jgi:hypothetical protein
MADAKISISLTGGSFELEGSETFVNQQIERFFDLIKASLTTPRAEVRGESVAVAPGTPAGPATNVSTDLDDIFAPTETGVQILKDIPGNSKSEKTVNAAKLYLFGMAALKQKDTVLFEEIKDICKAHGFYDANNMAANLKGEKEAFVFGGSGKKQTLKLTVPGTKGAAKLVEALKAGSKEE